jgi:hypothetical protein
VGIDESQEYPEVVSFQGIGNVSLLQIHIIAASVVALGLIFAILAPPGGYIALALFILLATGYDLVFVRKSQKPVRVSLYLRTNPVEASYGERKIGEIKTGSLVLEMENPNEIGFRSAPNRKLAFWIFDSEADAKIVAKRLLEYLPKEG